MATRATLPNCVSSAETVTMDVKGGRESGIKGGREGGINEGGREGGREGESHAQMGIRL